MLICSGKNQKSRILLSIDTNVQLCRDHGNHLLEGVSGRVTGSRALEKMVLEYLLVCEEISSVWTRRVVKTVVDSWFYAFT